MQVIETALSRPFPSFDTDGQPDESANGEQYRDVVQKALDEINSGLYQKAIASRAIDLPHKIDMVGISATESSPGLVMSFEDGKVTTEPLAGTRANVGSNNRMVIQPGQLRQRLR